MGGVEYHFSPQPDGRHVAEVDHPDHIGRFLSITEGYRLVGDNDAPLAPGGAAGGAGEGAGVNSAGAASTHDPDPLAALPKPLGDMTREELIAAYEAREGKKPHHRIGDDRLRELLAEG